MNIRHFVKKENSGLMTTTLEFCKYEELGGHQIELKEPSVKEPFYGKLNGVAPDVELIHSQLGTEAYHNNVVKGMWMHGEPLSSVGNGVSMKAICDLAPRIDFFICMRPEEYSIWSQIKRTWMVPKGIDLEVYKPLPLADVGEKLEGNPAILLYENWRGMRNPLYLVMAMPLVIKKLPEAKLHLYNCCDKRMADTFQSLNKQMKSWTFLRTIGGPVKGAGEVNKLLNRADMVVSCLYPLYARSLEALGAGKPFLSAGYKPKGYPWPILEYSPESFANGIVRCWENYDKISPRKWAEDRHDVKETVKQSLDIYRRYIA